MELTAEAPLNLNETSLNVMNDALSGGLPCAEPKSSEKHWLFSSEKAREANRKSLESKRKASAEAQQAKAIVSQLQAAAIVEPSQSYVLNRLARTRTQLEQLDGELESATDPKAIKALCDSIRALSEVERILAGRPLPGSNRPTKASTARPTAIEPSE